MFERGGGGHKERHLKALDLMPGLTLSENVAKNNTERKAAYRNAALQAGIRL